MDLILWRHAEAVEGAPDHGRVLTAKGRKQATRMGQWLDARLPTGCRILVSPAVRTVRTAEALGRPYRIDPALGTNGNVQAILTAAHWPSSREPVLIVGHQPTLGRLASYLMGGSEQDWTVRKGNIWWISTRETETSRTMSMIRIVMAPELIG